MFEGGEKMFKKLLACGVASLAMTLCACQSSPAAGEPVANAAPTPAPAAAAANAPADPKVVEEIRAVLAKHDKALGDKNLDAVLETFAPAPNTVVLGTSPAERWVGAQEIKAAYTEIFKDYDPGTMKVDCEWKNGNSDGTMAWLAATCNAKDSLKGKAREYPLNVSAAMVKQDGQWRFTMLHMSNPTAPSPPQQSAKAK
jgi:uncharacterized protein (TIGR02246 family)